MPVEFNCASLTCAYDGLDNSLISIFVQGFFVGIGKSLSISLTVWLKIGHFICMDSNSDQTCGCNNGYHCWKLIQRNKCKLGRCYLRFTNVFEKGLNPSFFLRECFSSGISVDFKIFLEQVLLFLVKIFIRILRYYQYRIRFFRGRIFTFLPFSFHFQSSLFNYNFSAFLISLFFLFLYFSFNTCNFLCCSFYEVE